ncbi:MAG: GntR family transcriptional regulator [Endomicrobiaceae bacterium]|nr:GntR family transcriptional regulator [Endomicrobiaceae bacterium]
MKKEFMPLYIRIKSDIVNRIIAGELKKGDRLPSEKKMAELFGVSRITVIGALRELAEEGIIKKIRGSGSYIDIDDIEKDYEDVFVHVTSPPDTVISFGMYNPSPQYEQLIKTLAGLFQLENPDIKIAPVSIPFPVNPQDDAFLIRIASGMAPSVAEFFIHSDYAALNALVPLENMPGFDELAASLHPQCACPTADAGGIEHIHALAFKINTRLIFANSRMLRDAGLDPEAESIDSRTLEEWVTVLGKYTASQNSGDHGIMISQPESWRSIVGYLPYLWGRNENSLENSLAGFLKMLENPRCSSGINLLSRLINSGNMAPFNGIDMFSVGKVGLLLSCGPWPLVMRSFMADKFRIKAYPIPSLDDGLAASSVLGNYCLGIFRSAVRGQKEMDASWKWIKFLFRKRNQFALTYDFSSPALKNVSSQLDKYFPEIADICSNAIKNSTPQFDFKNIRPSFNIFAGEIKQCFAGKVSAKTCIKNTISRIRQENL